MTGDVAWRTFARTGPTLPTRPLVPYDLEAFDDLVTALPKAVDARVNRRLAEHSRAARLLQHLAARRLAQREEPSPTAEEYRAQRDDESSP